MKNLVLIFLVAFCNVSWAQNEILKNIDDNQAKYAQMSEQIWQWAEPGYMEEKTSELLIKELEANGFTVQKGVGEMTTAFVATFGSGYPTIGILAEMDALPGLSQEAISQRKPKVLNGYGHGCGHNLFGVGSVAAAISTKKWMEKNKIKGSIKLIGTPAEEGAGGGKTYLVKEGIFKNIDVVLHWHPGDNNNASPNSSLAYRVTNFTFEGLAAHASASPEKGRSALDAVEAMNYMVNMMREHLTPETRIHYVIKNGGLTSNIVPDYAMVEYTVRNPSSQGMEEVWKRVMKAAEAAAHGTETKMSFEIMAGLYNLLPNETLAKTMQKNLELVGGVKYDAAEIKFAEDIRKTVATSNLAPIDNANTVKPYFVGSPGTASTDVGDVSYVVATAGLSTATWVPGVPAHSWQAVACDGMSIGQKGMINAAKTIALTAKDLFSDTSNIEKAKEELYDKRGGKEFVYKSLAGDRKPPLDYRK
jgi:aminobenzoyl-glutamate utilization protein B